MLRAQGLVKGFTDPRRGLVRAVDGLDLHVTAGEIVGLLGPNGAGKTTTLRMLATLLSPDAGSIEIDGIDALRSPLRARARMAYVPAEAGLPPELSGREEVRLFARLQGARPARGDALLEELGAGSFADAPTSTLSTGQKRRIVLARALVHDPPLLLLDEPTDGLDVAGRREVMALRRHLAAEGRAVLLSSHVLGEVEAVCDRAVVVARGRAVAEGSLAELRHAAASGDLGDAFLALTGDAPLKGGPGAAGPA